MIGRTDLALESAMNAPHEGIKKTERGKAFRITEIEIESDEAGKKHRQEKGQIHHP